MKTNIVLMSVFVAILACFLWTGCEQSEDAQRHSTPSTVVKPVEAVPPPTRFNIASATYHQVEGFPPNVFIYVIKDTQGSNDFILVLDHNHHAMAMQPISRTSAEK